jgi:hypothetical protein
VSYARTIEGIDPERIAVVGVCMGGGYAVSVGARDKRIFLIPESGKNREEFLAFEYLYVQGP